MGNFILFLILICLTVLDLGCSGSSREVYFHEAYRVLSPGLPACCCPEQIISALCLHLTHTLKTDVNNGCRPGGTSLFPSKQTGVEGATVYRENGEAAVGRTSYPRALWRGVHRIKGWSSPWISPSFFKRCMDLFLYLWLCWVFMAACGFSLAAMSGDCSPVGMCGLLTVVASPVAECLSFWSCSVGLQ